ncbi:MAG: ABC transporter substrate-binding protein, partial [Chloroflexi bacterium]|nr:ABC transporter substrate-binding protein [Chloroflexota bacterium]
MSRTRGFLILIMVAMLVITTLLPACAPKAPPQQFKLRMGIIKSVDLLPYYVLCEQGFDKKNGLHIIEQRYQGGSAVIKAIADGSVDIASSVGTMPVLLATENGIMPDKAVCAMASSFADPDHPTTGVLVGPSVTNWKDLEGKHIGVNSKTSVTAAGIIGRLHLEGVTEYTLVEISLVNMGLAVAGGNIAAASMTEPYVTQSLLRQDGRILDWVIGGKPFDNMEFTMIVFSTDIYKNNPEAVKAYLRAHLEAVKWIEQNPEKARSILAKKLSLSTEVGQKMNLPRFPLDGRNDPALLES